MYQISFPNIGIHLKYVPDSFQIFGIQVRLYGLIIALGFLIALAIISKGKGPDRIRSFIWIICYTESYHPSYVRDFIT